MDRGRLTLLGVPIDSVGQSGGTELGPRALRKLLEPAGLDDAGDTERQIRGLDRDPRNGWLAYEDNLGVTAEIRERVGELIAGGRIPVVLGGCCTLLPGALAGARDSLGEIGLACLDGHLDLFTGETSPTGEGADMPVAAALGMAPPELLTAIGPEPPLDPVRTALIGARDREEFELIAPLPAGTGIGRIEDRDALRHADLDRLGASVAGELEAGGRYWIHLDVDILDPKAFPATDYLMDDGLSLPELKAILRPLAESDAVAGISVTCFNPEKDRDGQSGAALATLLDCALIA
ncbi:MAG: arginase family protein [Thermoleophilia bacterium]|nr:arginase family protein [Thermoleophilia bacterium]